VRCEIAVALVVAGTAACSLAGAAQAAAPGSLTIRVSGLPSGQRAALTVRGPGLRERLHRTTVRLGHVHAGRYVVTLRAVRIVHGHGRLRVGATAYPARKRVAVRVRSGRHATLAVRYGAIVNPLVRPLPRHLLGVIGNPQNPQAVVLPGSAHRPAVGTIYTSAATRALPLGVISRVTATSRQKRWLIVSLVAVPLSEAAPQISFRGNAKFHPAPGSRTSLRSGSSSCAPPDLVHFGIHFDGLSMRRADFGIFPPQMHLQIAVSTTESLGVSLVSAGIECDWDLGNAGTFQAVIPVGPITVPVYVTLPIKASLHITGTLNLGTVNLSSTTVAGVAAGFKENRASLSEEGARVWTTISPSLTGEVSLNAMIGVQGGIGVAKGANVHVEADFGPEFDWATGEPCELKFIFGALSAGVTILGKDFDTPQWSPLTKTLWSGCPPPATPPAGEGAPAPDKPGPGGSGGGGSTPAAHPAVSLARGGTAPQGSYYAISLSGFSASHAVSITCYDSASPNGFYTFSVTTNSSGNASTSSACYSGDGPDHWVVAGGVTSNHVSWSATPSSPPPAATVAEQESPHYPTNTFTNYHNASGLGQQVAAGQWVQVSCKVYEPTIQSVNPDGYWYRIATSPWNNAYYAPANNFLNGDPPQGPYSRNTDWAVPNC
jgi:hypothetical protein